MGKSRGEKKRGGFLSFIFKLLFSAVFIILWLLVMLFTISYFGYTSNYTDGAVATGWEWAQKIPYVTQLYQDMINKSAEGTASWAGIALILVGLDVVLLYFGIMFIIQKIPLIGRIIKWLTGIIPTLSIIAIIIGFVLIFVVA